MSVRTAHVLEQKWRSDDIRSGEDADFSSLLLPKELLKGLKAAGFKYPSPIQLKAIPVGKIGKDLIVQAKSGTGKTLVFSVIALNMLLKEATHPQVLIMAPTREIACQICQVIKCVAVAYKDFACEYFIGGRRLEEDMPRVQGCQVIVGTPGRIKQMISCKILKTAGIRLFVLDEADQLLKDSSFITDIDDIFRALPRDKQMIATSATYPDKLKRLTNKYFRDPLVIRLNMNDIGLLGMVHYYHVIPVSKLPVVAYKKKLKYLEDVLLSVKFAQCLVFCNMVSRVENLCVEIKNWGFATSFISSAREQNDRLKAIELLKKFKCKVLVSSDVSSRGIDAENVDLVINFDLPTFLDTYFHRVGRAGRYGSKCASITLITSDEIDAYQQMQQTGKFKSFPLPDLVPSGLISMQPKMKHIVKDEELPFGDETESSSDSSLGSEDLKQEKTENGFSEDIKSNSHNGLCSSKVDEQFFENLANPSKEKLVDSEENTETKVSHDIHKQSDYSNSNSASSAKEDDNLSTALESVELEIVNPNSLSSGELKQQEGPKVYPSTEIVEIEKENNKLNVSEESFENSKLVGKVSAEENSVVFEENIENYQSDKCPDNIHELQQIIDTSSCLGDVESICEKTVNDKSLVANKKSIVSKILSNTNSKALLSSVITFIKGYENDKKEAGECVTGYSPKSSQTPNVELIDEKFSAEALAHLRSNLSKYQYNVCKHFIKDISEDMIIETSSGCERESVNQVSESAAKHSLKENDDENKIKCSILNSRHVLFSTPKTEVNSGSKSGHSSGQESSTGSYKDKLVEHFNSMAGTIDEIKSSNKNSTSESSSSSELNSDTSVNSRNAMYRLTKEFNKVTQKAASGYNKGTNKNMGRANIINNTELSSSSSDSDSGTSVDSEKAANKLEREFTKLIKVQKSDKSTSKDNNKTKKILQKIKGMKKCFEGVEIVDAKKYEVSSSNSTSDSDYNDIKKHVESSKDSSSDSDISTNINKKKGIAATNKCLKSSSNKKNNRNTAAQNVDQYSKESSSGSGKIPQKGKTLRAETIKGPVQNKITYYYSGANSSETESDIDQYYKESSSGSRKIHNKGKTLQAKTMKVPVRNENVYYSGTSSSETESDIDQYSVESQSGLQDGHHQRKMKAHKKGETLQKTEPSQFNYSSCPNLNTAGERQTFEPAHSYYQMQPTNYAADPNYQMQSTNYIAADPNYQMQSTNYAAAAGANLNYQMPSTNYAAAVNPNYQMQSTNYAAAYPNYQMQPTNYAAANPYYQPFPPQIQNHGNPRILSGTHCSHQMAPINYMFNPHCQPYPQQVQSHANYGLFPGTEIGRQIEPTSYNFNPSYQPYPSECSLKESCQISKIQPSGSGDAYGNVQSNYKQQQNYALNQCCVPSQHPCHPPNEHCQSPACAAWYDMFYKQWQFLNRPPCF